MRHPSSRWLRVALPIALAGCGPCRGTPPPDDTTGTEARTAPPKDRPPSLRVDEPLPAGTRRAIAALGDDEPSLVVLVILDTVRADHTSMCGYERPTTPFLAGLAEHATAWSCRAYSPSSWTLPSHATFFTGAPPTEHGVLAPGVELASSYETLAEHFRDRGYQTLLLSANPTLGVPAPGLTQGFERTVIASRLISSLRGRFKEVVGEELDRLDGFAPLLLVVNLFDAHDPYPPIPRGLDWVPPQAPVNFHPWDLKPTNPYVQFVTGTMTGPQKERWTHRVVNGYDHGIRVEDRHLAMLFELLDAKGWLERRRRIAIVSDHGEYVGERDLLRHGSGTYEPVTRVPLVWIDSMATAPLTLPEPVSAAVVHGLLRDGALPDPLPPPVAVSTGIPNSVKPSWDSVSAWGPSTSKLMWLEGKTYHFDLDADPEERLATRPPEDHPRAELLRTRVEALQAGKEAVATRAVTPEVQQALEALGYVE